MTAAERIDREELIRRILELSMEFDQECEARGELVHSLRRGRASWIEKRMPPRQGQPKGEGG